MTAHDSKAGSAPLERGVRPLAAKWAGAGVSLTNTRIFNHFHRTWPDTPGAKAMFAAGVRWAEAQHGVSTTAAPLDGVGRPSADAAVETDPMTGFACVMRDDLGREFLAVQTFGESRGKAKRAAQAMNSRRMDARKQALEMLRVCEVGVRVLQGQPPVDNRFVAEGCDLFAA